MNNNLKNKFSKSGILLDSNQIKQFELFYELLIDWNSMINLTAITEYDEVVEKHFIDSVVIKDVVDMSAVTSLVDIGTGAGFPGIPIKIIFPHIKVTLLDSLNKRVQFLNEVIRKLKLDKITTLHGRAEDYAKDELYREKFDLSVSRAVANLSTLSEYCIPYVKKGGYFISYKSGNIESELEGARRSVHLLGGNIEESIKFKLAGTDIERSFIKISKKEATLKKYPRKAGLPSKEPL